MNKDNQLIFEAYNKAEQIVYELKLDPPNEFPKYQAIVSPITKGDLIQHAELRRMMVFNPPKFRYRISIFEIFPEDTDSEDGCNYGKIHPRTHDYIEYSDSYFVLKALKNWPGISGNWVIRKGISVGD